MRYLLALLLLTTTLCHAQIITTIAGTGVAGYSGDDSSCVYAEYSRPLSVKFNHNELYIVDYYNNVIRMIDDAGIVTTVVGNNITSIIGGYSGDGGPATGAELNGPVDIAFDSIGNIYISDNGNEVIRKIDRLSRIITTIAGTGITGFSGDNSPATNAELNDPVGLVFDNFGNLYFSDAGNGRVRKINSSGIITTIAGCSTRGYGGDNGPATAAQLNIPNYLGIDHNGNIYVPDWPTNRVRKVSPSGIITTVAGNGVPGNTGDGGAATIANLFTPEGVTVDTDGNLYISSSQRGIIRKVDTGGYISTLAGTGINGYSGDGGLATTAQLQAEAICSAVDSWGNLYIADSKNNRIRMVTYHPVSVPATPPVITTLTLYPDPATNELTITAPALTEGTLMVTNLLGRAVHTQPCHTITTTINVADLPPGMYFVSITGTPYTGRFIKE